jgi:hypothetical protein
MKHLIAHSRNGAAIYVELVNSPAAARIAQQPHLLKLVKEVLEQTATHGADMCIEKDMGRSIGYSFVVETSEKDTVLFAQLLHDDTYTRFVKHSKPLSTQYLTIILRRDSDSAYEVRDTWIGRLCPPRPGGSDETDASRPFWANHAFIFEGQPLQLRTVTKKSPY